ncbi:MAG TPA: adenosine deaminase [Ktedonobacteraceae bacterium]|nr:adenosine deaminase [Ktedonobacteraceae bacterium]
METSSPIQRYLRAAPKAELHVHLEGSIQPTTLLTLAKRNGVELPVQTIEEMQTWFRFRDFDHFVNIYFAITRCLRTVEDYELIVYEFGAAMAQQNIRYAEVTFTPSIHRFEYQIPHDTYFTGLMRGRERAHTDFGVEIRWVFDIVRSIEDAAENRLRADYTAAVAIESRADGVVALGLGGAEVGYPPERFQHWFDQARAAGLHSAPHAGETVGPASVWEAIRTLGAERLGHGVRSMEDPALIKYLADQHLPLEVCPTSNICLGIYPSLAEHPLPGLQAAGIPITINSDDPALFNITLTHEVELLESAFHFDLDTINECLLNGVRYSFLPSEQKQALETTFRAELFELQPK